MEEASLCCICRQEIGNDDHAILRKKGTDGINTASVERGSDVFAALCRCASTNKKAIARLPRWGNESRESVKSVFQRLTKEGSHLKISANTFTTHGQTRDCIGEIGDQAMSALYSNKTSDLLADTQFHVFNQKISYAKSFVMPERLPPTVSATTFHSMRASSDGSLQLRNGVRHCSL
jgi:hypothetical protein